MGSMTRCAIVCGEWTGALSRNKTAIEGSEREAGRRQEGQALHCGLSSSPHPAAASPPPRRQPMRRRCVVLLLRAYLIIEDEGREVGAAAVMAQARRPGRHRLSPRVRRSAPGRLGNRCPQRNGGSAPLTHRRLTGSGDLGWRRAGVDWTWRRCSPWR
jgi:hypothetical protein